jgi:hypothetical protein
MVFSQCLFGMSWLFLCLTDSSFQSLLKPTKKPVTKYVFKIVQEGVQVKMPDTISLSVLQ